ncbi:MAG: VWA domain-containing protein [Spirochaetales bacterium]|nr:VWA domain-containing protein [Spirochaetales bacterium]
MARKFFAFVFLLTAVLAWSAPQDFIVVMDMSNNMFDSYSQVVKSYFPEVVKDHLKARDVFHLITFTGNPELQLSQRVDTQEDVETVLRRMFLLQPLSRHVDTVLALRFVYQYALSLPEYQNKTIVVFLSGYYRPEASSKLTKPQAQAEITSLVQQIKNKGWNLRFIMVGPQTGEKESPKSGEVQLNFDQIAKQSDVPVFAYSSKPGFSNETLGTPRLSYPSDLGTISKDFTFHFQAENPSNSSLLLHLKQILYKDEKLLSSDASISLAPHETRSIDLPARFSQPPAKGPQTASFRLVFDDPLRAYPQQANIHFIYKPSWDGWLLPLGIILGVLALGGLLFLLFQLIRRGYEHGKALANQHVEAAQSGRGTSKDSSSPQVVPTQPETFSTKKKIPEVADPKKKPLEPAEPLVRGADLRKTFETPKAPAQEAAQKTLLHSEAKKSERFDEFRNPPQKSSETLIKQKETARYDDFKSARKTQDFSAFLKKSENEIPPHILTSVPLPNLTPPELTVAEQGERKDYSMLVWTPDFVFQNTRKPANLFRFRPGDKKAVGGTKAHYKILLAPIREDIAEVFYDGENLSFRPLKSAYFPSITSVLSPCTGKDIQVLVDSEKIVYLRFFQHFSKTEEINKILTGNLPTLEDTRS